MTRELGTLLTNLTFRDNMHTDVLTVEMPVGTDSVTLSHRLKSKVTFFVPMNKRAKGDVYITNDTARDISIAKVDESQEVKLQLVVFGG